MLKKLFFTGIVLCIFLFSGYSIENPGTDIRKISIRTDSIMNSQLSLDKIPGAVVLIKKGDKEILKKAYGYACKYDYNHNPESSPEVMTTGHLFDIASLTKVIGTTTSIMLLVDKGLISVDDQVCRYIKAFDTPEKSMITIRHLLTHTAGLYEWYPLYYFASDKFETYRLIENLPLMFPVGQQRRYSDLGFVLLGEIVEIVSGQSLDEFMKNNIFTPLGMKNTTFNPLKNGIFDKIVTTSPGNPYEKRMVYDSTLGYSIKNIDPDQWNGWRKYNLRGEVNDGNTWYANGGISGAAGLFSTAEDLSRLTDMLINKGKSGKNRFISPGTIELFLSMDEFNNGLGWMMDPANSFMKDAPRGTFGHTGFTGTSIVVIPSERLTIIILINRQNTGLIKGEYYNLSQVRQAVYKAVTEAQD